MKKARGDGLVYQPSYRDKRTGDRRKATTWWIQYQLSGTEVPWLFHRNGRQLKDFRKAWATACQKAGVQRRLPDDLRRTAVRNLEYAGVSRSTAMAIVGHRSESIYRSISTVDGTTLRESASKIAAFQQARISAGIPKNDVNK